MSPEARLLFHELVGLSPEERTKVLSERSVRADVRSEVESLLSYDSPHTESISNSVSDAARDVLNSSHNSEPRTCGPYRLVRLIGSGGMAAVYLGERIDGEIQGQVAVKLLGTQHQRSGWRERFLKERQLLASLSHPSIVHVMDAGHTDEGSPYLVMEYIDGQPVDEYASAIPLRDRLKLLLRICEGISHAHSRLIIHRDLKPSNILVDRTGQPKVLDFGIAKLLDDTGSSTRTADRLLTPGYASPEQLTGDAQTTATDIYSLGAILYKLLTGHSPHEIEGGASLSLDVIAGKREIPAPSDKVSNLPGDLDFITLKALRTEPKHRYLSVDAFAADISAFLESRPVEARAGNTWYKTGKFLRRYWPLVGMAAIAIVSLSAGLYVANRGRTIAERRFSQVRQLSRQIFELDRALINLPGSIEARHTLVKLTLGYLDQLDPLTTGDTDLAHEMADLYWRVAGIQGVPTQLNLGDSKQAEISMRKADTLIEYVLSARPDDDAALYRAGVIANDRMILAGSDRRDSDAAVFARKSAARLDAVLNSGKASEGNRRSAWALHTNIALAFSNMGAYSDAVLHARKTIQHAARFPNEGTASGAYSLLANALRYQGDLDGALKAIREARRLLDQAHYRNETVRMLNSYGIYLREGFLLYEKNGVSLDRPAEAATVFKIACDLTEQGARRDNADAESRRRAGTSCQALGNALSRTNPKESLAYFDLAIRRLGEAKSNPATLRSRAQALANSSYSLRALRQAGEAERRIAGAVALLTTTKDYPAEKVDIESAVYAVMSARGDHEADTGRIDNAIETYEELLRKVLASSPTHLTDLRYAPKVARLYQSLASLYTRAGNAARASEMDSEGTAIWRQWEGKLPGNAFVQRQLALQRTSLRDTK